MCLQQISALYFSSCMKMCCDVRGSSKNMRMYVSSVMYLVNYIQQPTKSISLRTTVALKGKNRTAINNVCVCKWFKVQKECF